MNGMVPAMPTGISYVTGVAFVPINGVTRTRLSDGTRLRVLRGTYSLTPGGPALGVTLIPQDGRTLQAIERVKGGSYVRYHGKPRPWKAGHEDTVMAVMCDRIEPITRP